MNSAAIPQLHVAQYSRGMCSVITVHILGLACVLLMQTHREPVKGM